MIEPCEYKCLVIPETVDEFSEGGIIVSTGNQTEREQQAQCRAVIVRTGGNAFTNPEWQGTVPKAGDTVLIAKFAGYVYPNEDDDRGDYRLINDKDIAAVVR